MKIANIDDKKTDREYLTGIIKPCLTDLGLCDCDIREYESGEDFLAHFEEGKYDSIFLDIYMDGMNGIEIGKRIRETDVHTRLVFVSISNDFASESYAVHADYYLLKPFGRDELMNAIKKIHLPDTDEKIIVTLPNGEELPADSIIYTTFSGHYVTIFRVADTALKIRCTQKCFEQCILHYADFVLCTKGMIANLNEVSRLEADCFIMSNGDYIPISRRKYTATKNIYSKYLIKKNLR